MDMNEVITKKIVWEEMEHLPNPAKRQYDNPLSQEEIFRLVNAKRRATADVIDAVAKAIKTLPIDEAEKRRVSYAISKAIDTTDNKYFDSTKFINKC